MCTHTNKCVCVCVCVCVCACVSQFPIWCRKALLLVVIVAILFVLTFYMRTHLTHLTHSSSLSAPPSTPVSVLDLSLSHTATDTAHQSSPSHSSLSPITRFRNFTQFRAYPSPSSAVGVVVSFASLATFGELYTTFHNLELHFLHPHNLTYLLFYERFPKDAKQVRYIMHVNIAPHVSTSHQHM